MTTYTIRISSIPKEGEELHRFYFSPAKAFLGGDDLWTAQPESIVRDKDTAVKIFHKLYQDLQTSLANNQYIPWLAMLYPTDQFELIELSTEKIISRFSIGGIDQVYDVTSFPHSGDFPTDYLHPDWSNENVHWTYWAKWVTDTLKGLWHTFAPDVRLAIARQAHNTAKCAAEAGTNQH